MSKFYFITSDDREFQLSSTVSVSVSEPAVVTRSPVESGDSIVDNYYLDNKTITFSGVLTNVSVLGQPDKRKREVNAWIDEVRQLRLDKEMVSVIYDTNEIVSNCVITQFNINKSSREGDGWLCDMTFQEVDISERARVVEVPEAKKEVKDQTDSKSSSNTSSKTSVSEQALATTMGGDALHYLTTDSERTIALYRK